VKDLPGRAWGLVSRPTWRELRLRGEREAVQAHPIWQGEGVPDGRGRRLGLVPGFLAGAKSFALLEPWLQRCGWDTRRAPVGRNTGPPDEVLPPLEAWLEEQAAEAGGPIPVLGHSRGGQEARVLAVRRPSAVGLLICLGAPLRALYPPHVVIRAPVAALEARARLRGERPDHRDFAAELLGPFPAGVPFVSIFSRSDGYVDRRLCLDLAAEPIELDCTHLGLTGSVAAFTAIAGVLGRLDG
jgi:pimeloyl-ACP methyl ester carboxylesterase